MSNTDVPDRIEQPTSKNWPDVAMVFKDAITAMSIENSANRCWWYTWLASRDRFNAALWGRLCIHSSAVETNMEHQSEKHVFTRSFVGIIKTLRRLIAEVVWFSKWWHIEKLITYPNKVDAIIVTHLGSNSFKNDHFQDIYFGNLVSFLNSKDECVLVCGMLQGDPAKVLALRDVAKTKFNGAITSFGAFIQVKDFFNSLKHALFNKIKIIDFKLSDGTNIKRFLSDDIHNAIPDIFHCLMIEQASARMLLRFPSARVIHIYENNPWEHAVDHQAFLQKRETIGFLHCAVLPSHLKYYIAEEEIKIRPSPDRIVCTGSGARDVFLSLGKHNPDQVAAGCDLRATLPRSRILQTKYRQPIRNVLIVLEALPSMVNLLKFMNVVATEFSNVVFSVRAHPSLPLKEITHKANIKCYPNGPLIESHDADLLVSLDATDIIIYQGTTVAMTALYLGIPVIKIENSDPVEDDPLFELDQLKWRVKNMDEMRSAFESITKLDQDTFLEQRNKARTYLENYMASPTTKNMSSFLKMER